MNRLPFLGLAVLLAGVFGIVGITGMAGCGGGGHSPSEPVGPDRISLLSINPAAGTRIVPGSIVFFNATVDYELQSETSGAILFVFQDQDGHLLTLGPQAKASVNRGRGTATLSDIVTVPAQGVSQVRVYLSLVPPDISATQFLPASPVQPFAIYPVGS